MRKLPKAMISPKIAESRIRKALEYCPTAIYEGQELIQNAITEFGESLAVSCSFGSCSVVVLHMALKINPKIKVVFNNTGVQYPETYAYRDLLVKDWDLNLIETKPIKNFWRCVKEYGFPLLRGPYPKADKPKCCTYLKENPFREVARKQNIEAILTGLRASESRARMFCIMHFGQFYYEKTRMKVWKFHPIAFWNRKQVMSYFERVQIPLNPVYEKHGLERTGCMPCTGYKGWEKTLARSNPALYHYVQKLRGVSLIDDFIKLEDEAFNGCDQVSPSKRQAFLEKWF